jgi:hypothetical protein
MLETTGFSNYAAIRYHGVVLINSAPALRRLLV